jgi:hypothetical protein
MPHPEGAGLTYRPTPLGVKNINTNYELTVMKEGGVITI